MADLLESAGITRVVTIDLHAAQIQGFFNIPFDHMPGGPILAEYIKEKNLDDMIVVSPDLGGVSRARNMAERLNCGLAIIDKRRPEPGVAEVMNLIGSVEGKTAILVDDMVDTAGSLTEGARALKKFGAKEIYACCTHPVLTDPALSVLRNQILQSWLLLILFLYLLLRNIRKLRFFRWHLFLQKLYYVFQRLVCQPVI